jgi:hypothetical protein
MMPESLVTDEKVAIYTEAFGIRVSSSTIQTVRKNTITFTLSRADVNHLELHRGFTAERPVIQIIFSLALLVFCLLPIRTIVVWLIYGGTLYDVILILLMLLPLGIWLLINALHRGLYILARLSNSKSNKLAFKGTPSIEELQKFAGEVSSRYGCIIHGL